MADIDRFAPRIPRLSRTDDVADGARNPTEAMTRLLGYRPPLAPHVFKCGSQVTRRWTREGYEGHAPAMPGHLVATYYEREQDCAWVSEGERLAGRLRRGTITVIPEGRDGHWHLAGRTDVSQLYLTDQRLRESAELLGAAPQFDLLGRVGVADVAAARVLEVLALESVLTEPAALLFVDRALDLVCLQLIAGHSSLGELQGLPRRGLADWQAKRVVRYMRENLDRVVRLDELAALVGLSRFHFCTAFHRATGLAPQAYLVRLRVQRACELLHDTGLSIGEIAAAVGYGAPAAFSAAFRRIVGVTPSDYRRQA